MEQFFERLADLGAVFRAVSALVFTAGGLVLLTIAARSSRAEGRATGFQNAVIALLMMILAALYGATTLPS